MADTDFGGLETPEFVVGQRRIEIVAEVVHQTVTREIRGGGNGREGPSRPEAVGPGAAPPDASARVAPSMMVEATPACERAIPVVPSLRNSLRSKPLSSAFPEFSSVVLWMLMNKSSVSAVKKAVTVLEVSHWFDQ